MFCKWYVMVFNNYWKWIRLIKYIYGYFCCRFMGNYGVFGVLDRLYGIDKVFWESLRFKKYWLIFFVKVLI